MTWLDQVIGSFLKIISDLAKPIILKRQANIPKYSLVLKNTKTLLSA